MNNRKKAALTCAALSVMITSICLYKTTSVTMMALFNLAMPLSLLGIALYLFDVAVSVMKLRIKAKHH